MSKQESSDLIDRIKSQEPATSRQEYFLKKYGKYRPGMSKQKASDLIDRIKS